MSDSTTGGKPPQASYDASEHKQAGGEAKATTADLAAKARDAAGDVRDEAAGAVQDVKAAGASVMEAGRNRASGFAEEQKHAGAEQASGFARAVHRAADELQDTSPQIASHVHEAASSLDDLSRVLRDRSPGELLSSVEGLAQRQPVAFFGAAVLAGFAMARFAKSSAERLPHASSSHDAGSPSYSASPARAVRTGEIGEPATGGGGVTPRTTAAGAPGWVPEPGRTGEVEAKPATMAAASLGGSAARSAATGPESRNS